MRYELSTFALTFALLGCGSGTPPSTNDGTVAQKKDQAHSQSTPIESGNSTVAEPEKNEKLTFPYFLPDSRIVIGEDLVDEVNKLPLKEEQIQFLIAILPPTDQEKNHLTDRQLYAIRLLSLTDSNAVIAPLMDRFEFVHKGDGWPVVHAMARLGERSIEPLLQRLQKVASNRQKVSACGAALIEMKKTQFPMFIEGLKQRKDLKLSDKLLDDLQDQIRFAPDN